MASNQELKKDNEKLTAKISALEDKANKNSRNSSKPPSSDAKDSKKNFSSNRKGATHGYRRRKLLPDKWVTDRECVCIHTCKSCGGNTKATGIVRRHQQVDVGEESLALKVTQWDLVETRCTSCNRTYKPSLTAAQRFLLGPRLEALVQEMMGTMPFSHRNIKKFLLKVCIDLSVSLGLLSKVKNRGAKAMDQAAAEIQNAVGKKEESVYGDCTGWRHLGKNMHIFVACTSHLACFRILAKQNQYTIAEVLGGRKIHIVCDRGLPIQQLVVKTIQYCLPHALRNIQGLAQKKNTTLEEAQQLGELHDQIQELFVYKHREEREEITTNTWKQYSRLQWRYIQETIENLLATNVSEHVERFLLRFLQDLKHFKTYLKRDGPMTNNSAERALRPAVIHRKLTFGTRSAYGLVWRERILSCCTTLYLNACNAWNFLTKLVEARRLSLPPPSILEAISYEKK